MPGTISTGIVHVVDRHSLSSGLLEAFEAWNLGPQYGRLGANEELTQLRTIGLGWRRNFRQQYAVTLGANTPQRRDGQLEGFNVEPETAQPG